MKIEPKLDISLCKDIIRLIFACFQLAFFTGSATVSPSNDRKYHYEKGVVRIFSAVRWPYRRRPRKND